MTAMIVIAVPLGIVLAALLAFAGVGIARRRRAESAYGEWNAARSVLAAIPDGLFLVRDGRICSVNRALCELLGFPRQELLGEERFPFWPPEHRHEIEAWHAELEARGDLVSELTFCRRGGDRLRVLVAGRVVRDGDGTQRELVTVRDISESHRRERRLSELSSRDPETGLLARDEFEERLGQAARRAGQAGSGLAVVLAQLDVDGGAASFARPEALVVVDRLRRILRAGDELGRTGPSELAWILPDTDAAGAVEAVSRWRRQLEELGPVELTAGVCDLAAAGNAVALFALADRALDRARRHRVGATERYTADSPVSAPSKLL